MGLWIHSDDNACLVTALNCCDDIETVTRAIEASFPVHHSTVQGSPAGQLCSLHECFVVDYASIIVNTALQACWLQSNPMLGFAESMHIVNSFRKSMALCQKVLKGL